MIFIRPHCGRGADGFAYCALHTQYAISDAHGGIAVRDEQHRAPLLRQRVNRLQNHGFVVGVEELVPRHDELAAVAELNVCNADAAVLKGFHLFHQRERINDDAVADHVDDFASEDTGRDQVEYIFFGTVFHGMAGIVAALEANDHIGVARKNIDDFSFTFITPLGTHNNY